MEYEKRPITELRARGGGRTANFRALTDGEMMFVPTPDGRDIEAHRTTLLGNLARTGLKPHTSIDREKGGVWVWHDPKKAADA